METTNKGRKPKRKPEEDLALYLEYTGIPNGQKAAFMRKHGLYPAEIERIKETVEAGALEALVKRKAGRKKKQYSESDIQERDKRIRELEASLADTVSENRILKKKVNGV